MTIKSIMRKAYTRTTSTGKKVYVKAGLIKSVSTSGKKRTDINKKILAKKSRARRATGLPCKSVRLGYTRKAYAKKSGAVVKKSVVAPICLKSRKPRKNPIGPLAKGDLTKFGYKDVKSMTKEKRHRSLTKAIRAHGYLPIIKKLNAIAVLSKNRDKVGSALFKEDQQWLSGLYKKLSPKVKAKKMVIRKSK
jgi:hypothetical protein